MKWPVALIPTFFVVMLGLFAVLFMQNSALRQAIAEMDAVREKAYTRQVMLEREIVRSDLAHNYQSQFDAFKETARNLTAEKEKLRALQEKLPERPATQK